MCSFHYVSDNSGYTEYIPHVRPCLMNQCKLIYLLFYGHQKTSQPKTSILEFIPLDKDITSKRLDKRNYCIKLLGIYSYKDMLQSPLLGGQELKSAPHIFRKNSVCFKMMGNITWFTFNNGFPPLIIAKMSGTDTISPGTGLPCLKGNLG